MIFILSANLAKIQMFDMIDKLALQAQYFKEIFF
jgi:hypothetical protein